ncbi:signal recognition particle subunit SRP72 isoform X1 [Eurytemora carolleeae]|nr:signal recognition particle subunit SRP72 isoform X1 [Eurytemora carolleeae]|eukprot:XP_023323895.1 signal recognition particle subunit SRP72-like isoform X1 [Eurytemora affinis]
MSKKDSKEGKEGEMKALYRELNTLKQNEEYEKAIKTCNRILNLDHGDVTAFHCKIVAMIHTGKFQDALKQIDAGKLDLDLSFEIAYCHYRLNELEKSLKVIQGVKNPELKHDELKAQILYKLEMFDDCFSLYRNIIKNSTDEFETERKTNISAVAAQVADPDTILTDQTETYELRYNCGCGLAAVGEYDQAEVELVAAESQARQFLAEEGDSAEDIEQEVGIIRVQLAYVLQKQGKEKEAQNIYNSVLKSKPDDIGLVAVASNNLLAINRDQNIFDSKKRIKAATAEGLDQKLTRKQRNMIQRNQVLLAMFTAQVDLCKQLVDQLDNNILTDRQLIIAGVLAKSGKYVEAVEQLEGTSSPENTLTAVQVLLTAGEVTKAVSKLEGLPVDWKYKHGVLSTLVSLYLSIQDRNSAATLLKEATEWNMKKKVSNTKEMSIVWRKTAEFHLKSGEASVAAKSLEEMLKVKSDLRTLAQLVLAYAKFDLNKAMQAAKKLPAFDEDTLNIDIQALEDSAFSMGKNLKRAPITPRTPKKDEGEGVVKKKNKKKKKRLPKNYNPNVTPDPERWIPRKERTGLKYLPGQRKIRKDKRKGEKFTGAQGTAAGQSDNFDYSAKVGATKEPVKASPQAEPAPGPRLLKKGPAKGKKKSSAKKGF